ncbi:MAG: hypothetical protein EHM33_09200 [Chloroflexi bacterium]|jgi:hypothetical protein|nr:MAG: hypothetical protein EHM33_09200 [Chloroflexota bacterium]
MDMNKQKIRTYHSEALSLLTLRIVLTDARRDVPPHVSKNDMNEELAAKLIKKMKRQYKRYLRFIG